MNIYLIIYLIGCFFALLIGIREMYETENMRKNHSCEFNLEPQYGMLSVLVLLSWLVVILWAYNKYTDNIHK
jgi:Na+/H+ antiporter NhaC